jgi:hypothetical protein
MLLARDTNRGRPDPTSTDGLFHEDTKAQRLTHFLVPASLCGESPLSFGFPHSRKCPDLESRPVRVPSGHRVTGSTP